MKKPLLTFFCFLGMTVSSFSQDPNFSQFFVSPLTLSPALTGKFDGKYRVAGNYRNQWPSINHAFITSTISADFSILNKAVPENDNCGFGLLLMTDKSANGVITSNYMSVSLAYHKGLDIDGLHQLSAGFQGTYAGKRLNGNALNLEDELDLNGNWTKPSNDPVSNRSIGVNYFDANAGLLYQGQVRDNALFFAGLSVYHLSRPKETFFSDGRYTLPLRYTFHAGGYIETGYNSLLHLSALHSRQGTASNTVVGGALEFLLNNDERNPSSFYAGSWYRWKDAVIPYAGLEFNHMRFGVSYDVNISSLKTASSARGGMELSIIYINNSTGKNKGVLRCPKF